MKTEQIFENAIQSGSIWKSNDMINRVRSTGEKLPLSSKRLNFPKKIVHKKNLKVFQILILFDDDIKESVKITNVQKCDFSQS